ncbi:MAG: hypothetical protein ABUK01_07220 [Leptospirales bacterium]
MVNPYIAKNAKDPITNILEIRLCPKTWDRINSVAKKRKKSYSWILRYLLFRLIKRSSPENLVKGYGNPILENKYNKLKKIAKGKKFGASTVHHRHRMCLYGSDELNIRLTAARFQCTMTHLVRLAIEWYLEELENKSKNNPGIFFEAIFFILGKKILRTVKFPNPDPARKDFVFIPNSYQDYYDT